jgi:hypothetical protein
MLVTAIVINVAWTWITDFTGSWGVFNCQILGYFNWFSENNSFVLRRFAPRCNFREGNYSVKRTDCIIDGLTTCIKTPPNPTQNIFHFQILNSK